jgi:hypothetical protein
MIIRATVKLLKISKIPAIKNNSNLETGLSGEWYSNLVSMGQPRKLAIHFLHQPTMISIIIPGKSLNKALKLLPQKCVSLLNRQGFSSLISSFNLNSESQIFTTNSRSMLAYMTQIKFSLEINLSELNNYDESDFNKIEDDYLHYIFTRDNAYYKPIEILTDTLYNN